MTDDWKSLVVEAALDQGKFIEREMREAVRAHGRVTSKQRFAARHMFMRRCGLAGVPAVAVSFHASGKTADVVVRHILSMYCGYSIGLEDL